MKEKPDVLSDEEIAEWIIDNKEASEEAVEKLLPPLAWSLEAQRDTDYKHQQNVVKEIFGEIGKINQPDPPAGTFMESPNMAWTNGYWACYEKVKSLKSKFLKEKKGN